MVEELRPSSFDDEPDFSFVAVSDLEEDVLMRGWLAACVFGKTTCRISHSNAS